MATIRLDLNNPIKKMKPMHGGGQPLAMEGAELSGARYHIIDQERLLS